MDTAPKTDPRYWTDAAFSEGFAAAYDSLHRFSAPTDAKLAWLAWSNQLAVCVGEEAGDLGKLHESFGDGWVEGLRDARLDC